MQGIKSVLCDENGWNSDNVFIGEKSGKYDKVVSRVVSKVDINSIVGDTNRFALVAIDADNVISTMRTGFDGRDTISRIATFSSILSDFFSFVIPNMFEDSIIINVNANRVILICNSDSVLENVIDLMDNFKQYTNNKLTLSIAVQLLNLNQRLFSLTLYCEDGQFANNKALHNVRKGSFTTDSMNCSDLSVNLDNFSLNSAQIYSLNNSFVATCRSKGSQKVDVFVCENFVSSKNGLFVIKAGTEIRDSSPQAKTHGTAEAYILRQRYSEVKGNKRFTTTNVVLSSLNMVAVFINGYNISAPDAFSIPTELRTGLTNYEALKKMYVKDNDIVQTNSVDDSITRAKSFMDIALEEVSQALKTALSNYEKELEQLKQQNKKLSDKLNSAEDEIKVLTKSNETLVETNKSLANSLKVVEDLVDAVKSETVLTAITKLSEYKRVS